VKALIDDAAKVPVSVAATQAHGYALTARLEYAARMDDDDLLTLRCEECLTQLEVAGTTQHPYWFCPSCKVARLS
jgi:hypothetical protein